jgi:hypothetical protein
MRSAFDNDPSDDGFPLGDGTADTEGDVTCPHCGESVSIALDPGSGASQEYVEDCPVCCRPWVVHVHYNEGGATISVSTPDA